jgi:hypothetical protein
VLPPHPPGSSSADGELVVGDAASGAFIAFYRDAGRARRLEAGVVRNAVRVGWKVEQRGAVTVIWVRPPASELRNGVDACAFK